MKHKSLNLRDRVSIDRISIDKIKYKISIIKYYNLDKKTRKKMIYIFKKCEKNLIGAIPTFFTLTNFLGNPNPPKNTIIFLLYRKIKNNKKILIGFLVFEDLFYKNKLTQQMLEKYIIKNKKGGYLWWICGNNRYRNISKPLFNKLNKYLDKNKYKYILLVLDNIKSKNKLLKLYEDKNYKKIGFTSIIKKNDMIVMKKSLFKNI